MCVRGVCEVYNWWLSGVLTLRKREEGRYDPECLRIRLQRTHVKFISCCDITAKLFARL